MDHLNLRCGSTAPGSPYETQLLPVRLQDQLPGYPHRSKGHGCCFPFVGLHSQPRSSRCLVVQREECILFPPRCSLHPHFLPQLSASSSQIGNWTVTSFQENPTPLTEMWFYFLAPTGQLLWHDKCPPWCSSPGWSYSALSNALLYSGWTLILQPGLYGQSLQCEEKTRPALPKIMFVEQKNK